MQSIVRALPAVAESDVNVLIFGENGTGKEVLAKQIHAMSPRSQNEIVSVNCAAIPEALLESELFGHRKGSFTGATADHIGLFELADGGTVFLDEIGDMPMSLQAKILRVLQERKIRAVGGASEKNVDFKLISATHRDLKMEISKGHFREDLFYRLSVVPLHLPPLRERKEDIANLVETFLSDFAVKYRLPVSKFSDEAMKNLIERPWPGNIRQLENTVEHVIVMHRHKDVFQLEDLPQDDPESTVAGPFPWDFKKYRKFPTVSELTNDYIHFILNQVDLHQGEASRILGLSRRTIYRKLNSVLSEPGDGFN